MKTFIFFQKFIHIMIFPPKNDFQRQVKFGGTPGIKNIPKQEKKCVFYTKKLPEMRSKKTGLNLFWPRSSLVE